MHFHIIDTQKNGITPLTIENLEHSANEISKFFRQYEPVSYGHELEYLQGIFKKLAAKSLREKIGLA